MSKCSTAAHRRPRTAFRKAAASPAAPGRESASPVARLQKAVGNRAMARALGAGVVARKTPAAGTTAGTGAGCAGYEADEIRKSRTGQGHLAGDVFIAGAMSLTGRVGDLLIVDFGVDWGSVKDSTARDPLLRQWIDTFESSPDYRIEIEGYSDCVGEERDNDRLRRRRATKVFQLFDRARPRVLSHDAAPAGTYLRDNADLEGRATNRGVAIRFWRELTYPGEQIEVPVPEPPKPPVPAPPPPAPDTVDCSTTQRDALARALPKARDMTSAALSAISRLTPESRALLKKYFGPDAIAHRFHIKQNFVSIRDGLDAGPKFECEEGDSYFCDGAVAYVFPLVGTRIHICSPAIDNGDDFLARTIVHEGAHGYAFAFFPDDLCAGGCPTMDTEDAEDNADSYGEFAGEAINLP